MNYIKILFILMASFCICTCTALTASAAESDSTKHYYTEYDGSTKSEYYIEGEEVVALVNHGSNSPDYSPYWYETKSDDTYIYFYRLNAQKTGVERVNPRRVKTYTLTGGEWVCTWDSTETGNEIAVSSSVGYKNWYYDFTDSGIDIIQCNMTDRIKDFNKGTGGFEYKEIQHSIETNLYSYMLDGVFIDYGTNYLFTSHESLAEIVPTTYNHSVNLDVTLSVTYDEENGEILWNDFYTPKETTIYKGVIAQLHYKGDSIYGSVDYVIPLSGTSYELSFGGTDFKGDENCRYDSVTLIPYYISTMGSIKFGGSTTVAIDADSVAATRTATDLFTATKRTNAQPSGIFPSKNGAVYGTVDPVDAVFDTEYATYIDGIYFRGFSADYGINAKWKDVFYGASAIKANNGEEISDLFKFVAVRLTYAYKESPNETAYIKYLDKVFKATDCSCYVDYTKYKSEDPNVYLKEVAFIPFFSTLDFVDLDVWFTTGDNIGTSFYYGSASYVRFTPDEKSETIKSNVGDIASVSSSSDNSEIGDMDISLSWFQETLSSLINGISQIPNFFATMFSFLPSPVVLILGAIIVLCVILRLLGR